jgi:hypothetical protein
MKFVTLVTALILSIFSVPNAWGQDWTKIVPLLSTCQDVKKIFGADKCDSWGTTLFRYDGFSLRALRLRVKYFTQCREERKGKDGLRFAIALAGARALATSCLRSRASFS